MQTGEQAAAPAADSQSIEARIGAWFSTPSNDPPQKPKQATPAQAPAKQQETQPEATDQVPEETEATSDEAPAESTAPTFEEVEYEGKTYQVPPELKEAIIRQGDYTRKTQEVADARKVLEHQQTQMRLASLVQEFEKSVSAERNQIQMLDYLIGERAKANWSQMSTDELVRARMELDQWKEQRSAVEAEIGKKQTDYRGKFNEQMRSLKEQGDKLLKQRIPQWSDASVKEVRDWALEAGFSNDELSAIYDPRHIEVLWKASQYDKTRKSAVPAVTQAKAAKVSAANPMPAHVRESLNFRKAVARTEGKPSERRAVVEQRVQDIFRKR